MDSAIALCHLAEAIHVLPRDVLVGADVDHVQAIDLAPQVDHGAGDKASGYHRLAQPDLIADQYSTRGIYPVKAVEGVIDSQALEVLKALEGLVGALDGWITVHP